jgi:hypothetical protein
MARRNGSIENAKSRRQRRLFCFGGCHLLRRAPATLLWPLQRPGQRKLVSLSCFAGMEYHEHHQTLSIVAILEDVGGACHLQHELAIFLAPGDGATESRQISQHLDLRNDLVGDDGRERRMFPIQEFNKSIESASASSDQSSFIDHATCERLAYPKSASNARLPRSKLPSLAPGKTSSGDPVRRCPRAPSQRSVR